MQNEQAQALRMSAATLKKEIGKFNNPSALSVYLLPHPYNTFYFNLFTEIEFDQKEEGEVEYEEGIKYSICALCVLNPVCANKHTHFPLPCYFCCILFRYVAETVRSTYKWVTETFSDTLLCLRVKAHDCCGGDDRRRGTT